MEKTRFSPAVCFADAAGFTTDLDQQIWNKVDPQGNNRREVNQNVSDDIISTKIKKAKGVKAEMEPYQMQEEPCTVRHST